MLFFRAGRASCESVGGFAARTHVWLKVRGCDLNDDEPGPEIGNEATRSRLATLRVEHEDLDACVVALEANPKSDQIRIARLKKKKLLLRDEIVRLEDQLTPDIIA